MKTKLIGPILSTLAWLSLTATVHAQSGGTYDLNWFTIDGGGGTSSGGAYSVSGTIGQPDAGVMSGGTFSLSGGFWPGISNPEPIPRLRIELDGTDVMLAWPDPSTGYQLQEAGGLNGVGTVWTPVSRSPAVVGLEKQVRLPAAGSGRFFRLCKPGP